MVKKSKKRFVIQLSGPGLFIWSVIAFAILGWSFVLGILVGRGSIPEKLKHLADLNKELALVDQRGRQKKEENMQGPTPVSSMQVEKLDFFQKLAEKKEGKVPLAQPKKTTKPPSRTTGPRPAITVTSSKGQYTIQLASFDSVSKATALVHRLVRKGLSAYYVAANTSKGRFYRVRCGHYASRQEAVSQLHVIATVTGLKGFVCRR